MGYMRHFFLSCIIFSAFSANGNDSIAVTMEQLQAKKDSLLEVVSDIDKKLFVNNHKQLNQDSCGDYLVCISPEYYDNIRIRPIINSPIYSSFGKRDTFRILSVMEDGDDTYYGISDGNKTGFIQAYMVNTGLHYEKEPCIKTSYVTELKKKHPDGFCITLLFPSEPNSAGGVNVKIGLFPFGIKKTIKYISFQITPFNPVGDSVCCTISYKYSKKVSLTGPIKLADPEFLTTWENCWYNRTISCVKLNQIVIEYADGSKSIIKKGVQQCLDGSITNICKMTE